MKTKTKSFSTEERAAMKERFQELNAMGDGESQVMAKIKTMPEPDRSMAKKVHELVSKNAPSLSPKTWYGMPAYADKEGKVVCFFQDAAKFKARYATLGFSDRAKLDDGNIWPSSYALKKITTTEEKKIVTLIKKAVGTKE